MMMNSRNVFIAVGILAAVILSGCGTSPKAANVKKVKNEKQKPPPAVKAEASKVKVTWSEQGKPSLLATADEVSGDTISGSAKMREVTADLYDNGKLVATLTAPTVEADANNRIITASGGVTLASKQPNSTISVVKAGWIKWIARQNKVLGGGGVEAVGTMTVVKAEAFEADTSLRKVKLDADPKQAEATFRY